MDDHHENARRLSPSMTPERLRPHLEGWLAAGGPGRTFVVHLDGPWAGSEQLLVGDHYVDVRVCPSELSIREELARPRPDGRTVVLLSQADVQGADVLARIAKRRVLRLHAWEAVQSLFGVRQIDPLILSEKWMAEALVEAAPPGGYEKTASRALDADRAWRTLLQHRYGIDSESGLDGLLTWAGSSDGERLSDRSDNEYAAVWRHLSSKIPGAEPALGAVAAGKGRELAALGLVARVLADGAGGEARAAARALATMLMFGGWLFDERQARELALAAEARVSDLLAVDGPAGHAVLRSADAIAATLNAEALVGVSDLLTSGLRARRTDLGAALARRRTGDAAPGEIERTANLVRGHRISDHRTLATMVTRLVRWLDGPSPEPPDFHGAARSHAGDASYADWARTALRSVTGEATLDDELRALVGEADARRREQDVQFGALLSGYIGHAAPGAPILGVEEVLDRVVAPIARERPVMFVVLDGMSHRVASELVEDVIARGWTELRPSGQEGRTLVMSALPSVTAFSRTSLLSGELVKGKATDEAKAFAAHPGLVGVSARGGAPLLFHKGSLKDPHGGLASALRSQVAGDRRVVGVVINAIDDHLAR
ncbi:MAG: BREX-2 system phosphatase PglZ, partial [Solirubrobacteraceae bacterium]